MATDSLGRSYPEGEAEFRSWFRSDAGCLDYLDWLRWPRGFVCPYCEDDSWRLADGRHKCKGCKRVVSATAGTIFHGTRTPLTLWFAAAWVEPYPTHTSATAACLPARSASALPRSNWRSANTPGGPYRHCPTAPDPPRSVH